MEKYSAFRIVVVDNYNHFYGQGGQAEKGKCPLWSDNANLHRFQKIGRFSLVQISYVDFCFIFCRSMFNFKLFETKSVFPLKVGKHEKSFGKERLGYR